MQAIIGAVESLGFAGGQAMIVGLALATATAIAGVLDRAAGKIFHKESPNPYSKMSDLYDQYEETKNKSQAKTLEKEGFSIQ